MNKKSYLASLFFFPSWFWLYDKEFKLRQKSLFRSFQCICVSVSIILSTHCNTTHSRKQLSVTSSAQKLNNLLYSCVSTWKAKAASFCSHFCSSFVSKVCQIWLDLFVWTSQKPSFVSCLMGWSSVSTACLSTETRFPKRDWGTTRLQAEPLFQLCLFVVIRIMCGMWSSLPVCHHPAVCCREFLSGSVKGNKLRNGWIHDFTLIPVKMSYKQWSHFSNNMTCYVWGWIFI